MKKVAFAWDLQNGTYDEGDHIRLVYGYLSSGDFEYNLRFKNLYNGETQLHIELFSGNALKQQFQIISRDPQSEHQFQFSTQQPWPDFALELTVIAGEKVKIVFPVTPVLKQRIKHLRSHLEEYESTIVQEVEQFEKNNHTLFSQAGSFQNQDSETQTLNKVQVETIIHKRYFRGLITTEEAESQMDFVVRSKLFAPNGERGFSNVKRKFYRGIFQFIYRLLSRNSHRKRYISKIYRNYLNNNTLADNFHDL